MTRLHTFVVYLSAAVAAVLVLGATSSHEPTTEQPSAAAPTRAVPGPMDIVWADPRNMMFRAGPTADERMMSPQAFNSNITVTYGPGFASVPQAQAAFQAAVDIWRAVITSPVSIRVNANYQDLGNPNILGSAGPTYICTSSAGQPSTYYAAALADKLTGTGARCSASLFEINANFNSTFSNWDFGTSGVPVGGKYNFLTVVLHELGHGLGHYGSMTASGGIGQYRAIVPDIYDRFAVTGAGAPLLGFASPSAALGAQLVSNDTFFNGAYARSQNGNANAKLDTHNFGGGNGGFQPGSSYSHIDEVVYSGTVNGLMTYALAMAEVYTDPGPVVRGIFADEGWGASTLGSNPVGALDTPTAGAHVGSSFAVAGWAIDRGASSGTGIDQVHIYAYPSGGGAPIGLGVASYGGARSDVGAAYGAQFTNSGFSLVASGLANGSYQITAFGHSTVNNAFSALVSVAVTVGPTSSPAIALGAPMSNSTSGSTVTVNGWAVDTGAPSGTGVDMIHVYAFPTGGGSPTFMGQATYGGSRPDVGAIFGSQFTNSGFQLQAPVAPGTYNVVAYMRSTVTGTFNAAAVSNNVTVNSTNSNPTMLLDGPPNGASRTRPFVISGWAVDTGAPTGTGIDAIHIWAFPTNGSPQFFVGVGTYGTSRPDVGTYLGNSRFNNSGFTFTVTSGNVPSPGTYDFQIFGHSTVTGSFTVARVVRVTVN